MGVPLTDPMLPLPHLESTTLEASHVQSQDDLGQWEFMVNMIPASSSLSPGIS